MLFEMSKVEDAGPVTNSLQVEKQIPRGARDDNYGLCCALLRNARRGERTQEGFLTPRTPFGMTVAGMGNAEKRNCDVAA
jgi:hypothetical protein